MRIRAASIFFILFLVFFQAPALAQNSTATPTAKPTLNRLQTTKDKVTTAREKASAAAQRRAEKLSEARLKVCKGRTISLRNRVKNTVDRGRKMHARLENLVSAVDKFYTNRLVPQGLTLENHDELLADIDTAEANVKSLLDQAKVTGEEFDCESDDPKGQLELFKEDMKEVIEAFKEYKLSVRAFVKEVKDLAAENSSSTEESEGQI
ncbi:MAG: hypothetical protein AAB801_02985 [Patescibacteria group bacterium]